MVFQFRKAWSTVPEVCRIFSPLLQNAMTKWKGKYCHQKSLVLWLGMGRTFLIIKYTRRKYQLFCWYQFNYYFEFEQKVFSPTTVSTSKIYRFVKIIKKYKDFQKNTNHFNLSRRYLLLRSCSENAKGLCITNFRETTSRWLVKRVMQASSLR